MIFKKKINRALGMDEELNKSKSSDISIDNESNNSEIQDENYK